jgi:LemA protein
MVIVGVGVGIAVLLMLFVGLTYNGLVGKRNRVHNAWAQIDVQLKRRYDLIPNLMNTVRGYLQHERQTLEQVVRARQQINAAGGDIAARASAENAMSGALRGLFVVAENYPVLKADQNMRLLQEELASTENKIAFARQFYNDAVMEYNTARERLPAGLVAPALGFAPAVMFTLDDHAAERAAPVVQF